MKKKNNFESLIRQNIHFFIWFIILSYALSQIVVYGSKLISDAINQMLELQKIDINRLAVVTGILIAASMVLAFAKKVSGETFSIRIQRQCRNITVSSLANAEYSYIEKNSGALITRLTSDIGEVGELFSEILPEIFQSAITIITLSVSILFMDFRLLLGIIVCYPIVLFISDRISKRVNTLAKKRKGKYDKLTEAASDAISGIIVARSFGLYDILNRRIDVIAEDILKNEYIRNRYQAIANAAQHIIKWLPNVICSVIALIEVFHGNLSIGGLMAFIILFTKISSPMSELPFRINDAREMLVSMRRINDVINAPKEQNGTYCGDDLYSYGNVVGLKKGRGRGLQNVIDIKNLTYWYPSNPERKILNNLNVSFEAGKMTAIVGASGAGKSTLFKILCGFERAKEGSYKLLGTDFNEWQLEAARSRIAIVSQNVFLFPGTIAENVAYGSPEAAQKNIKSACMAASIHDYIISLPQGYNTIVGERGAKLSGGEKQRISIARALLKNSPIVLLDEPTSALDTKTEAAISKMFGNGTSGAGKTLIVIAHRLSTIKNADKIIVLDKGKVAECGTHQELLAHNGIYAGLYAKEDMEETAYEK